MYFFCVLTVLLDRWLVTTPPNMDHRWTEVQESSRCKHTEAVLSWILQRSKLATPSWVTMTPPPCKIRKSEVNKLHECYGTLHACGSECKHSHAATLKATSTAAGQFNGAERWVKIQGEFKMGAHMAHEVVMDVTAFKVCHSVVLDIDATAMQAAIEMSSST